MIVFMLVAQTGEAFAVSSMPCFGSERQMAQMMMNDVDEDTQDSADEMMQHDCCQQECSCPLGLMSLAVIIDINIQRVYASGHEQSIADHSQITHVFIPSNKRPPKRFSLQ